MSVQTMLRGVEQLHTAARTFALAGAESSPETASLMRQVAAVHLGSGAEQVRLLGGPFFARTADEMIAHAKVAATGVNAGRAIEAATEGERWLLGRIAFSPR